MKTLCSRMLALPVIAVLVLTCLPLHAQLTATAGEIAVRSNQNAANLATNPGDDIAIQFDRDVLDGSDFAASADHVLSQGKYLVLYSTRWDHSGGQQRAEISTRLTLEPAGGGAPVDLKYGTAQGFIRTSSGANEAVVSGGTIVEAAATGDILRLHGTRTDENATSVKNLRGTGLSSIQFLKLDDSWDYLRVSRTTDTAAPTNDTFASVSYELEDESSLGAMSLSSGTDITFNQDGSYLVMANTSLLSTNLASTARTGYGQRLTLDGTLVAGSTTTSYVRGHVNADGCHDGVLAIGTIVQATAGQVLNVQTRKEQGINCTITSAGTGLAIVQLPSTGSYLSLSDNSGQNLNAAAPGASVNFDTTVNSTGLAFSHTSGTSAVTVNKTGTYLFLSGFFCLEDTADRQVPWQTWKVNGTTAYGGSARYSRNNQIDRNGNWSGLLASLTATDTVEVNSQALGAGGSVPGNDLGLQGVHIESLFPSDDPAITANSPLNAVVNSLGNVITDDTHLLTTDNNTGADGLTYTIDTAITGGILKLSGTALAVGGTFTQADVNGDLLTFDAGAAAVNGGFDFTVSDGGGGPASGTFSINVGIATVLVADAGTTDEDTGATEADLTTGADLLANDTGSSLVVTSFDSTSTNGAAVTVSPTGTFTYDPTGSASLQVSAVGESLADTFDYTVTDVFGIMTSATVTITVDGVNDVPVVVAESHRTLGGAITNNLLANDSDADVSDTLTVSNFDAAGNGGAVPVPGPLVFASAQGATVSISSNGAFSYDPSTSAAILALADGATLSETFSYDVFDGTSAVATTVTVTSVGTVGASGDLAAVAANATVNFNALTNDSRYSGTVGSPTAGAELEFLADGVGNSSATWLNTGTATVASIPNGGTALIDATHNLTPSNPLPGMAATYDFAGTEGIEHDGFDAVPYGQSDLGNASIEFLFRPSDQVGDEVLLEVGGKTDGASICLVDNLVVWSACDNGTQSAQAVAILPPGAVAGGEWVHIVCKIDLASDNAEIWLNGVLTDSNGAVNVNNGAAGNLADWCGTDAGGIGRRLTDVGGDLNGLGNFGTTDLGDQTDYAGEVALLRTYESLLTSAQVMANFQALVGATVGAPGAGDVTDLNGTASPVPGTTVVVLPSGATVAFELDGSFTYDPNGAFDDLGVGLTAQESFTYTIDNHHNASTTVVITIDGTNTDAQLNLAADQASVTEGNDASFTITSSLALPSDVEASLSYSGTAQDGSDFNGNATVTLSSGGTEFDLTLSAIADSLYEGSETLTVTIDSVTGSAVLGANPAASTTIADSDSPPVLSIGTPAGNTTEGSRVDFTVTASVASSVAVTVDVAYSGAAGPEDFCEQEQITIPAGQTAATASLLVLDDAVAEGNETLTATISNPSLGSLATTETDGLIAYYDFNSDTAADTSSALGGSTSANDGSWTGTAVYKDGAFGRAVEVGDGAGSNFITASGAEYEFGTATSFTVVYWLNTEDAIPGDPSVIAGGGKNWSASGGSLGWVSAIAGDDLDANIGDGSNRGDAAVIDIDHDTYWTNRGEPGDHWNFVAMVIDRDAQTLTNYAADEWVTVSGTSWASGVTGQDFGQDSSSPTTDSDISNVGDLTAGNLDIVMGQDGDGAGYSLPASGLDDVSIWNRALTRAELWEIYAEGRSNATSLGAIVAARTPPNTATATIADGAGQVVFNASFEGIDPAATPGGTLLNGDAPFAANLGTSVGNWANVFTADAAGNDPGVIAETGADAKGDGVDNALRLDRPAATQDVCAQFDGAIDISGSNTGMISFDLATRRTQGNSAAKSTTIIGLDEAGNKSFELFLDANNNGTTHEQLFHVDSSGTKTALGNVQDFDNSGGWNEDRMSNVRIGLTSTGYCVQIEKFPLGTTPAPDTTTGGLSYAGNATTITQVVFRVSGSADTGISGGIYLDDVRAAGSALTTQEAWRLAFFGSGDNSGDGADGNDANGNGLSNLLDFAYGFNPDGPNSSADSLEVSNPGPNGEITQHGGLTFWADPATGEVFMRYARRTDYAAVGLAFTDQFSRDLDTFENAAESPEVIATGTGDDGTRIEAVQLKLPLVLPDSGGKARFGRNQVQINP